MRTPALLTCAPAKRRKLLRTKVLRLAVPGGRGRSARSGGAGSDPAVRGTATGSRPCAFAHPRPRPLGSLPAQRSLRGKAGFGAASRWPITRSPSILTVGAEHSIRRGSRRISRSDGVAARTSSSTSRKLPAARWCSSRWAGAFPRSAGRCDRWRPRHSAGSHRRNDAPLAFPHGIVGRERPPGRVGWPCTSQPSAMPALGIETGGSLPSSALGPVRHRRPRDNSATADASTTWTIDAVSGRAAIPCPATLDVKYTSPVRHPSGQDCRQNTVRPSRLVRHVDTRRISPRPVCRRARSRSADSRTSPPWMVPHTSSISLASP